MDFHADVASQGIGEERQLALSRNARIELAQRAGRSVAGIGKGLQLVVAALGIELGEGLDGHVHFAADFNMGRIVVDAQRNRPDGTDIVRNIFADPSVAAGNAADKLAVLVNEVDCQPVDFQLDDVFQRFAA